MVDRHPIEVQPALFAGGAMALQLEALVDPADSTVIFVVTARDVGAGKLTALWSSSPCAFDKIGDRQAEAISEWSRLLWEHSGPF